MSNVPAGDPGAFLLPYATTFCEWLVRLNGSIATCVESAEMVVDYMVTHGRIPVSAAEDTSLAQDLIARGQAGANGATDSVAASEQMARLGIPNKQYGADWFAANDFVPTVQAALRRGVPVLFGVYAAYNFHDDWTNAPEDQGVYGHGITLVGMDSTGAIVADPNTSQSQYGNFVHYSWANLRNAGGQYPSMVIPEGIVAIDISQVSNWFDDIGGGQWKCKGNGKIIATGMLDTYRNMPALGNLAGVTALGLPLSDMEYGDGFGVQVFERGKLAWDPQRKLGEPMAAGTVGDYYLAYVADPKEVAQLQAQLASQGSGKTPADIVAALTAANSVLAPFAAAATEVAKAQTEVVS